MRTILAGATALAAVLITCTIVSAGPLDTNEGERPAGWRAVGGDDQAWRVLNGVLASGNGDQEGYENPSILYRTGENDWGMTDYVIRATVISHQENGTFQLLARYQDPENYYALEYRDRTRMERIRLTKVKDGEVQYNRTVGHGFRYDNEPIPDMHAEPVQLVLEVRDGTIRATVNGRYPLEIEDADFPRGTAGLGTFFYDVDVLSLSVLDPEADAAAMVAAAEVAAGTGAIPGAEVSAATPEPLSGAAPEATTAMAESDQPGPEGVETPTGNPTIEGDPATGISGENAEPAGDSGPKKASAGDVPVEAVKTTLTPDEGGQFTSDRALPPSM
jgi:hypothetical protein